MLTDLLPWPFAQISINPTAIAGTTLWSLALYLGLSPVSHWVMEQLVRWFNFAERSLYTSEAEFERTKRGREAQNAFYASIFSIIPFLLVGALLNYGVTRGLGEGWTISVGMIGCMVCGLYELGRRHSNDSSNP